MPNDLSATVVRLLREARYASLATLEEGGAPYVSLVTVAPDADGAPLLLLSDLARHTGNLKRDDKVSLLVTDVRAADPMNAPRASLIGRIARVEADAVKGRFLTWHADAATYVDFADFAFYRVSCEEVHLVEGFGRISTLPGATITIDWSEADEVRERAKGVLDHMNSDHADAIGLYATALLGAQAGDWRMIAIDPSGCDLQLESQVRRLPFPRRATSLAAVREVLVALAKEARN
ncbi:HugZ family protein [Aquabacter cavernae]|uniref:HugZ family pyridoxamine 5'-phosphate oxidase n=1 Tax=Aquabacter cavernae TaxID=2496029 RepID=UPI000F8C4659|nr:DUF2470 domain-containing protein [Aquabacter cavernae]